MEYLERAMNFTFRPMEAMLQPMEKGYLQINMEAHEIDVFLSVYHLTLQLSIGFDMKLKFLELERLFSFYKYRVALNEIFEEVFDRHIKDYYENFAKGENIDASQFIVISFFRKKNYTDWLSVNHISMACGIEQKKCDIADLNDIHTKYCYKRA
ncbi:hypothetical protein V1478_010768 [Vespula squamosa]|uniref:Uncharacterized protein n=1 Tax=Vespula squamosa TaxID=30214 RepID=A0ABD2AFA6_VESSQ